MSRKAECAPCSVGGKAKGWSGESTREFIGRLTVVKYSCIVTLLHCYIVTLLRFCFSTSLLRAFAVVKAVFKTVVKKQSLKQSSKNCRHNNLQKQKMIKNMSIILSEHFRLTEFTISLVAYRAGRNRQQVIGHLVKR